MSSESSVSTVTANPAAEDTFLGRGAAARYLGVPVGTVYQWARSGRIPCVVTLGGHLRFARRDLDAFKARRARMARQYRRLA